MKRSDAVALTLSLELEDELADGGAWQRLLEDRLLRETGERLRRWHTRRDQQLRNLALRQRLAELEPAIGENGQVVRSRVRRAARKRYRLI